jgi:hypothetical protein
MRSKAQSFRRKKTIQTQLGGLELLKSLMNDLVGAGLGAFNAKSARQSRS